MLSPVNDACCDHLQNATLYRQGISSDMISPVQTFAAAGAGSPLLQAQDPRLAVPWASPSPQPALALQQQQPPALFMPKAHHHPMKQRLHDFARSQMRSEHTGTSGDPLTAPGPERRHRSKCNRSLADPLPPFPYSLVCLGQAVSVPACISHSSMQADVACTALLLCSLCLQHAHALSLFWQCSACSREDNGAEGEGRLPNDTGATSANPGKGFLDRASTWAAGTMPGAVNGSMWSPDALVGLYGGWGMAPQAGALPADPAGQQGMAAAALRRGAPGAPEGDWRSVVQAAAAAASQLEISKLSGQESTRSMDAGGDAPLASPPTSLCKAQPAPGTVARFHHKVILVSNVESCSFTIHNLRDCAAACICSCLGGCLGAAVSRIEWSLRLRR